MRKYRIENMLTGEVSEDKERVVEFVRYWTGMTEDQFAVAQREGYWNDHVWYTANGDVLCEIWDEY